MITAIELENFKGFGARQRIELGPLTLLFGANSAGKSSVLQALGYVRELLEHGDPNVDQTEIGGATAPLGGFGRLIHNHNNNATMRIRVEFDVPSSLNVRDIDLEGFAFPDLDDTVSKGWIEFHIACPLSDRNSTASLVTVAYGLEGDDRPIVVLRQPSMAAGGPIEARVEFTHSCLSNGERNLFEWQEYAKASVSEDDRWPFDPDSTAVYLAKRHFWGTSMMALSAGPVRLLPASGNSDEEFEDELEIAIKHDVETLLELIVSGLSHRLHALLSNVLHIGALRSIPSRGYLFEHATRAGSWGDGLAAWDALLADRGLLIEGTNEWLKKLSPRSPSTSSSLSIEIIAYLNPEAESGARAAGNIEAGSRRLVLRTNYGSSVLPSEVGAGISQVVPVIVAAVRCLSPRREHRPTMLFVEQPELHLHPAMQTGLGDLLRQASSNSQVIVETHSEHLILRLLRRIRDTAEGDALDDQQMSPDQLTVLHISNDEGQCVVRRFHVDRNGDFDQPWPNGFFEERTAEVF